MIYNPSSKATIEHKGLVKYLGPKSWMKTGMTDSALVIPLSAQILSFWKEELEADCDSFCPNHRFNQ